MKYLNFFGLADSEAMKKEDKRLKGKLTKNNYEQVPVSVTFNMTNKSADPYFFEGFGENCVRGFVERLKYLEDFTHNFSEKMG